MYKVFFKKKPVILSREPVRDGNYQSFLIDTVQAPEIIHKLQNTPVPGLVLYHHDTEYLWKQFLEMFEVVEAAGGLVSDTGGKYLVIFRNGYWDLPKGKIDPGEDARSAAVREVVEECGIAPPVITDSLSRTYHLYSENNWVKLKRIKWFLMQAQAGQTPVPQSEEGIQTAVFITRDQLAERLPAMHANLAEMLEKYLNNDKIPFR